MFTTTSTEKILFTLIGTLFVLCLFSTVGCGGRYQQELQELREELKEVKSERNTARQSLKTAESNLYAARQSLKTAESDKTKAETDLYTARQSLKTAESARKTAESNLYTARQSLKTAESARKTAESNLYAARQSLKTAESDKTKAETDLYTARQSLKTAESARKTAESNLYTARQSLKTAESDKTKAETDRENALKLAQIAEQKRKNLEKLVSLVPQAEIKNVKIDDKKKNIDISVTFSIKNRKDIEGSVNASFYFRNGRPLRNKDGPIFISKKFTPKRVTETLTVKLSISYAKLNLAQPSDLTFKFRIHDKPTDSFLDKEPYAKEFRFDPHRN